MLAAAALALPGCGDKTPPAPPPPVVTVAPPSTESVTAHLDFTGNTAAYDSVTLVARVEGYLDGIHFADGAAVKQGDLLFTIQRDQYAAQLEQAKAQVAAQKAAVFHAETELKRYKVLAAQDSAPETQVDRWQFERDSSLAQLHAAEAQVILAQLNLGYTRVTAPFEGRMGRHLIDVGNLVGGPGKPSGLAQIDRIDPLYVYFTVNERDLLRIRAQRHAQNAGPTDTIPAAFGLLDEDGHPHAGHVDFASLSVAPRTGTLEVRAVFPNPDGILPGLFVRLRVPVAAAANALVVPGDAVAFDQQGEYVLVVGDDDVVARRPVETGEQVGDQIVVTKGLQATDRVVVAGLTRAIPGRKVTAETQGATTTTVPH
ncbi:MAG: efflux RND transporter periplasmic adaptor subunit [bacterium]|nr:efflux RND transporter periplasmic adaptor subunit [bacterium]